MKSIWKFPLKLGSQSVVVPMNAKLLTAQMQMGVPMLWALVSPSVERRPVAIHVVGTGHELHDVFQQLQYLATIQEGGFVWHVFAQGWP